MRLKALISLFIFIIGSVIANAQRMQRFTYNELPKGADSLEIREGILSQHAMRIKYKRSGKKLATITLSEPKMVAQAEQEEKWGYFQFPSIGKASDDTLVVSWSMSGDTHKMYGKRAARESVPMMSIDGGRTWVPQDKNYFLQKHNVPLTLCNGDILYVNTPQAKNIHAYDYFPQAVAQKEVAQKGTYTFYPLDHLPDELQGVYFTYREKGHKTKLVQAKLHDSGALRYAIDSLMPIVWWGDIKQQSDCSLVAGIYPTYYFNTPGGIVHSGVSFYKSDDNGYSWNVLSRIPFSGDSTTIKRGGMNFEEPAFEILGDSTYICVMRTGHESPMYKTISKNRGLTWSVPTPFTPNGVKPKMLLLKNSVLVLVSGRPGIQIRFSLDGTGRDWTDPIDMMPFLKPDGKYELWWTCGYCSILEADDTSFYIVYSDFTTKNLQGNRRKSIMFRRIEVTKC